MGGINKVLLLGNLGKDPEMRTLEGGVSVAKFPLATSESHKDKSGNKIEQTEWHNIVLWRNQAEFAAKYLKKGNTVFLEGKIRNRTWEDKDKVKHYTTEIVCDSISIVSTANSKKDETGNSQPQQNTPTDHNSGSGAATDDLPF